MKSMILAGILALTASPLTFAPTQAASLTITTGESGHAYRHDDGDWQDNDDNDWHRDWYRMHHRGWQYGMRMRERRDDVQECDVTTTRHWRHGRMIIERTRECY